MKPYWIAFNIYVIWFEFEVENGNTEIAHSSPASCIEQREDCFEEYYGITMTWVGFEFTNWNNLEALEEILQSRHKKLSRLRKTTA